MKIAFILLFERIGVRSLGTAFFMELSELPVISQEEFTSLRAVLFERSCDLLSSSVRGVSASINA